MRPTQDSKESPTSHNAMQTNLGGEGSFGGGVCPHPHHPPFHSQWTHTRPSVMAMTVLAAGPQQLVLSAVSHLLSCPLKKPMECPDAKQTTPKQMPGILPCLWNPKALLKCLDNGSFPISFSQPCKRMQGAAVKEGRV